MEFAIGDMISDQYLVIFLSFQYILIKYNVQIGLLLYTIEHSHRRGDLRLNHYFYK